LEKVWKIEVPSKAKVMVWRLLQGRLASKEALPRRGVMSTIICLVFFAQLVLSLIIIFSSLVLSLIMYGSQ